MYAYLYSLFSRQSQHRLLIFKHQLFTLKENVFIISVLPVITQNFLHLHGTQMYLLNRNVHIPARIHTHTHKPLLHAVTETYFVVFSCLCSIVVSLLTQDFFASKDYIVFSTQSEIAFYCVLTPLL